MTDNTTTTITIREPSTEELKAIAEGILAQLGEEKGDLNSQGILEDEVLGAEVLREWEETIGLQLRQEAEKKLQEEQEKAEAAKAAAMALIKRGRAEREKVRKAEEEKEVAKKQEELNKLLVEKLLAKERGDREAESKGRQVADLFRSRINKEFGVALPSRVYWDKEWALACRGFFCGQAKYVQSKIYGGQSTPDFINKNKFLQRLIASMNFVFQEVYGLDLKGIRAESPAPSETFGEVKPLCEKILADEEKKLLQKEDGGATTTTKSSSKDAAVAVLAAKNRAARAEERKRMEAERREDVFGFGAMKKGGGKKKPTGEKPGRNSGKHKGK